MCPFLEYNSGLKIITIKKPQTFEYNTSPRGFLNNSKFLKIIFSLDGINPLRGSDGKVYSSLRRLRTASCLTKKFIQPVDIPNNKGNM